MKRTFSAMLMLAMLATTAKAQMMPQPLPVDTAVRVGQLANGLTYYVRHNEYPKQRAEFRIVQKVGAILEEDNQNGLAHFLEHMAFNGTKHFPGKGIINYFNANGVTFGADINAYTSWDRTVYYLQNVPTARTQVTDSALMVLLDWSCNLNLLPEEIDAERGVIREEWRTRRNANWRLSMGFIAKAFFDSKYSTRDIIGDTNVIVNFEHQALRDYYKKWYGPDLQGIIVVGDIDADQMVEKIKQYWDTVPARVNRGERPYFGVARHDEPRVAIVSDKEARTSEVFEVNILDQLPAEIRNSNIGYLFSTVNRIVNQVMNNRLRELTQKPESPFVYANSYKGTQFCIEDEFELSSTAKEGHEKEALKALLIEGERLRRYGITTSELEIARANILASIEKAYNERNNCETGAFTDEYQRNFTDAEPIPGIAWEYDFLKGLLSQISADEINQLTPSMFFSNKNMIVGMQLPENDKVQIPSDEEVKQIIAEVMAMEIEAPKEEVIDDPLVAKTPKAGKIKKTTKNPQYGTTEWLLSNGARVVIKPTTNKNDQILMQSISFGGTALYNTTDLVNANLACDVVKNNGVGNFTPTKLKKILAGKVASAYPSIDELTEGIYGGSSVKDFETMLQLNYLYFTAPRTDDDLYSSFIQMAESSLANRNANPRAELTDSLYATLYNHNARIESSIITIDKLKLLDQKRAIEIYKERFANAADFTFMFVGNINPDDPETQKQICTWIGGLPRTKKLEKPVDPKTPIASGKINNTFNRQMETKTATNVIVYSATFEQNFVNLLNLSTIADILDLRYLESIREREGGSYGVSTSSNFNLFPSFNNQAMLRMVFDTDPEKETRLLAIIHDEIQTILKDGPRADDLQKTLEGYQKQFEVSLEDNDAWLIYMKIFFVEGFDYAGKYIDEVKKVTAETVRATLQKLVDAGNVVEVVMMPKAE